MGPLALADMTGLDILVSTDRVISRAFPRHGSLSPAALGLVDGGHLGQKTGSGVYKYKKGDYTPHENPAAAEILTRVRREKGLVTREIGNDEITQRLVLRMVNEAFYAVQDERTPRRVHFCENRAVRKTRAGSLKKPRCRSRVRNHRPKPQERSSFMSSGPERKEFQSAQKLKEVMGKYFVELTEGPKQGEKTAWCTSVGPAELLRALGFNVFFPENHGAMLGATRMATDLIPLANARGFSPDICSYLTSDVGSYLKGESPLQKMKLPGPPKADVLVFNTNQCRDVKDWFQWYAREWNVPCLGIHTPRAIGELDESIIDDVARQTEALVEPLEEVAGQELDAGRLREVVDLSKQCTRLWGAVLDTAAHVPSPITFFDGTTQMGPAVVLRGHQDAVDYYQALLAELEQRARDGVAAVEGEQFRIYWEGMPIWGKLRALSTQMIELKTCVVASTYCNSWIFDDLDPADPFRSMARAYSSIFICRSEDCKERYIEEMVANFKVDGILYHDAKTCPNNSNSRYGMPQRLEKKLGKPFLVVNGDLNDLRLLSEEQTRTNIEAFVEQLAEG